MAFEDQLERYFGSGDLSTVDPGALNAAVERMQVDLGLATDAGSQFALWCLLFTLGQAPDIDDTFGVRSERDFARQFIELSEMDLDEPRQSRTGSSSDFAAEAYGPLSNG